MKMKFITFLCVILSTSTAEIHGNAVQVGPSKPRGIVIESLHVAADISYRFASTIVMSDIVNHDPMAQTAHFDVRLPKEAFITNFTMYIEGVEYPGRIEEKVKARQEYDAAVQSGQTAGYVGAHPRNTNNFKVSINVARFANVSFELMYNELLHRSFGLYEYVVYIDPGRIVDDMSVDVFIQESRNILQLNTPAIRNDLLTDNEITKRNDYAKIVHTSANSAHVTFAPTRAQQLTFSEQGISGQFILNYDVDRSVNTGEVLTVDGYFVHFFAPTNLKVLPKSIMFVLDVSGSMQGRKLRQMKSALDIILKELRVEDEFNIATFNSGLKFWSTNMVEASVSNVKRARIFGKKISAGGGTDINHALTKTLAFPYFYNSPKIHLIFFLTDGQATSGETSSTLIKQNVKRANSQHHDNRASIFSLAFGSHADFELIRSISDENNGLSRRIFEDSDASLQLAGFYDEISSPLLANIAIKYLDNVEIPSVTKSVYQNYFEGGEIVIAGRLATPPTKLIMKASPNPKFIQTCIVGTSFDGKYLYNNTIESLPLVGETRQKDSYRDVIEKTWAYLTVKQMLRRMNNEKGDVARESIKQKALKMSLKYHFVTPVTAMIVTKPQQKDEVLDQTVKHDSPPLPTHMSQYRPMMHKSHKLLSRQSSPVYQASSFHSSPRPNPPATSSGGGVIRKNGRPGSHPRLNSKHSGGRMSGRTRGSSGRPQIPAGARADLGVAPGFPPFGSMSMAKVASPNPPPRVPTMYGAAVGRGPRPTRPPPPSRGAAIGRRRGPRPTRPPPPAGAAAVGSGPPRRGSAGRRTRKRLRSKSRVHADQVNVRGGNSRTVKQKYPAMLRLRRPKLKKTVCFDLPQYTLKSNDAHLILIQQQGYKLVAEVKSIQPKFLAFYSLVFTTPAAASPSATSSPPAYTTKIIFDAGKLTINGSSRPLWRNGDVHTKDNITLDVDTRNQVVTVTTNSGLKFTIKQIGMKTKRSRSRPFFTVTVQKYGAIDSDTGLVAKIVKSIKYAKLHSSGNYVRFRYANTKNGKVTKLTKMRIKQSNVNREKCWRIAAKKHSRLFRRGSWLKYQV